MIIFGKGTGSGIFFDEIINKKDTIKQQAYHLISNGKKNEIRIPPKQTYIQQFKCSDIKQVKLGIGPEKPEKIYYINKQFIKAQIHLDYTIHSSPLKSIILSMEFDLREYKYNPHKKNK